MGRLCRVSIEPTDEFYSQEVTDGGKLKKGNRANLPLELCQEVS